MTDSIFIKDEFFLLVIFSIFMPVCIFSYLIVRKAISRKTVLLLGVFLITIAGMNLYLLRVLAQMAKSSSFLLDDKLFSSEISVALYLLPAIFATIGTNMLSHTLIKHLDVAERRFERGAGKITTPFKTP